MLPIKGLRFKHKRILCTRTFDGKTPQECVVTRVTKGAIYYRPVYDMGDREALGGGEWITPERWSVVCGEITHSGARTGSANNARAIGDESVES